MRVRSSLRALSVVALSAKRVLAMAVLVASTLLASSPAPAQTPNGAVVLGTLMWATTGNGKDVGWMPAREYCDTLDLAGHSDWRLPTLTEVETLYDPGNEANGYFVNPIKVPGCCLWSSTSLAELGAEEAGVQSEKNERLINTKLADGSPSAYYWGFLFAGGIRYYSVSHQPDGQALCVRAATS